MGKFLEKEDMTPLKEVSKVIDSLNTEEDKIINAPSINAVNEEFSKYQKKEDNALSTDSKNIVGAINEVSQNLTQEKSDLAQLRSDFNHFSTATSGFGNVNTEILSGECKYVVNGHIATVTIEFVPLSNAVIAHGVTICTDLPHPTLDLYCNDGITNCLLGVNGVLRFYHPQDTKNFTRRDFTITYMTH